VAIILAVMEKSWDFLLGTSDPEISALLKALETTPQTLDRRFTQQEDFFLVLERPFIVDSFEIHQKVDNPIPSEHYLKSIRSALEAWTAQLPSVFWGLSWFFDPRDLFRPLFVQVLTSREKRYLFVLRPDLTFRHQHAEVLDRGGNDVTPRFSTRHLFLEAEVLPLETMTSFAGDRHITLAKLFETTWQGETGQGYFLTGLWIDQEISKVLSRAAVAPGTKIFPYYPLRCRHGTLSVRCIDPGPEGRKQAAGTLEAAWPLVSPWAEKIQTDLKAEAYRENHPLVEHLRTHWSGQLTHRWGAFRLEPYLNEYDQKEYRYHGDRD